MTNLVSIAESVGAPRIVKGVAIPHPVGNPELEAEEERKLRRRLLERALEAVSTSVKQPTVFHLDGEEGEDE